MDLRWEMGGEEPVVFYADKSNLGGHHSLLYSAVLLGVMTAFPLFSQVTLLSGVIVPKEKFIVYIMIGHSNMTGRTPELDTVVDPHAWNFFITDCCQSFKNHTWVPARDCIHMDFAGSGGGPCMHFLKKMVRAYPDYYFGVVNNANSGAQCRANYLKGNGAGAFDLYAEMIDALMVIKGSVTFGGIICMLGVSESVHAPDTVCRCFSSDIALMVREFRDTLGLPSLPFIMGGFERDGPEVKTQGIYWQIVDSETNLVPSKVTNSGIVPSDSLTYFDRWHYTYTAYEIWTQRAIDTIQAHHWFPPAGSGVRFPGRAVVANAGKKNPSAVLMTSDALGRKTIAPVPFAPNSGTGSRHLQRILFSKNTKTLSAH
jgi:hypothetical protein